MIRLLTAVAALAWSSTALGADWPQWLGPTRDAASAQVIKPWTAAPAVVWRASVGEGHSSPVVAGGKVYLHFRVAGQNLERLAVFDAATGKLLASADHPRKEFKGQFGAGPRATPVISADGQISTLGVHGIFRCDQLHDGPTPSTAWSTDVLEKFHAANLRFGLSGSPLIDGDRAIIPVGGKGASLVAFDRKSGDVAWKSLDDAACYASPIIVDQGSRRVVVALTAAALVGMAAEDGALLWQYP